MAPQILPQSYYFLRMVSQRLLSTPDQRLPQIAPYLATIIAQCGNVFTALEKDTQTNGGSELLDLFRKFKIQLSMKLRDKSPQARYAATILIKATIEVGGLHFFQGKEIGSWITGLTGILGVSDYLTALC